MIDLKNMTDELSRGFTADFSDDLDFHHMMQRCRIAWEKCSDEVKGLALGPERNFGSFMLRTAIAERNTNRSKVGSVAGSNRLPTHLREGFEAEYMNLLLEISKNPGHHRETISSAKSRIQEIESRAMKALEEAKERRKEKRLIAKGDK